MKSISRLHNEVSKQEDLLEFLLYKKNKVLRRNIEPDVKDRLVSKIDKDYYSALLVKESLEDELDTMLLITGEIK